MFDTEGIPARLRSAAALPGGLELAARLQGCGGIFRALREEILLEKIAQSAPREPPAAPANNGQAARAAAL
jgi:hypothetical protein